MISLKLLCVLFAVIAAVSGGSLTKCARIEPLVYAVEPHRNLTVYCVLNQTCVQESGFATRAEELYWEINGERIPDSQYTANESVSAVTFQHALSSSNTLNCNINLYGHVKTTLHGAFFNMGYPPEKPQNLSCICYNKDRLTCTWDPGRPTLIPTNYTLKQSWRDGAREDCIAKQSNSCTLSSLMFQVYIDTTFWVVAKNNLGIAESDRFTVDIVDIYKPNAPAIVRAVSAVQLQRALKIEWLNPGDYFKLKYNLRYRKKDSADWEEVPSVDLATHRTSYTLQDLQPYTTYILSLRCKLVDERGYWSDWSKEYEATTPESAPSRGPELWRKVGEAESNGTRTVRLMWKDLGTYANGKILGYNVTLKTPSRLLDAFYTSERECSVTVPRDRVQATIVAYNSYDVSPPSSVIIPPATRRGTLPPEIDVKAFPKDHGLWVEWKGLPSTSVYGYILEWCGNAEEQTCEWQREPASATGAFLRGDLKPLTYYGIKVHPLYRDGSERPKYADAYLEQGVPEEGPTVHSKTVEKKRAVLVWTEVPLHNRNGFITNYTLQYGTKNGPMTSVTLNGTQLEYTMTSLTGDTVYHVSVTANTEKGGRAGPPFTFSTDKFDPGEVEAIVVSSCIGFLLLLLVIGILFCNKREFIKKHIWPNVPDPSKSNIAQWSPQTPTRHDSKNHPFQDGSFTDVSVVEITADEKKSYSEQDLKSVDLMKKNTSEGFSSGIGGSSCLSSPRLSISDTDEVESSQNTSSTVQYSTVIISGYRGQQPTVPVQPMFTRSESTQPLLESEERPDEQQVLEIPNQYFKQNCTQEDTAGRLQAFLQENLPPQEVLNQNQHLSGPSHETDIHGFSVGQNVSIEGQPATAEIDTAVKSYLPQTVRQGGYMPQ
ncbi:interleukin-6 receptor subunit beta isoform X2 [Hyperolius riggenbachi]|uniref:interleukin-6 receptor subunit beta isoform X2 n=1 Tax=Hyperolius riggenbachi TaxID=752182 RepID=UPI0035A3C043